MRLTRLILSSFRSYRLTGASFGPNVNLIEGTNGSGKSNLLEAISLLGTGKSFRTGRLKELIEQGQEKFILEALFHKYGTDHTLKVLFSPDERKVVYNQANHTSFISLLGILPSVFLSPEDIIIITGGPVERRRFLDLHIAQADPLYVTHLGRYQRALKQRNLLLKTKQKGLFAWEDLMAISAAYLAEKRVETLAFLERESRKFLLHLSNQQEPLEIRYQNTLGRETPSAELYRKRWAEARNKELLFGTTLTGPHRDEVIFSVSGRDVKSYASEGQKRCCLAALRLAEWETLKNRLGCLPLFGIDDFGVHLDKDRSRLLQELLRPMGQVFLTAPSFEEQNEAHRLYTSDGKLVSR